MLSRTKKTKQFVLCHYHSVSIVMCQTTHGWGRVLSVTHRFRAVIRTKRHLGPIRSGWPRVVDGRSSCASTACSLLLKEFLEKRCAH